MPPPFENKYKKTSVKTDKDCWTCRKTTTTCLLTDNYASGGDFLYTCEAHLKDRNFATPIETEQPTPVSPKASSSAPSVSQTDIEAAVKEYEERKKSKAASNEVDDTDKSTDKDSSSKDTDSKKKIDTTPAGKSSKPATPPSATTPPAPEATHYQLHKSFFDMRLRLHQQKKQLKEAQTRRSQLVFPSAPSDKPGASSAGSSTK